MCRLLFSSCQLAPDWEGAGRVKDLPSPKCRASSLVIRPHKGFKVYVFNESYKNVLHILYINAFTKSNKNMEEICIIDIKFIVLVWALVTFFRCKFLITSFVKGHWCQCLHVLPCISPHSSSRETFTTVLCSGRQWCRRVSHIGVPPPGSWACEGNELWEWRWRDSGLGDHSWGSWCLRRYGDLYKEVCIEVWVQEVTARSMHSFGVFSWIWSQSQSS